MVDLESVEDNDSSCYSIFLVEQSGSLLHYFMKWLIDCAMKMMKE